MTNLMLNGRGAPVAVEEDVFESSDSDDEGATTSTRCYYMPIPPPGSRGE